MSAEKLALYRATVARLERQLEGLEARRKQLPRMFLFGVALSPFGFFLDRWAPLWALVATGSIVGVGYYIVAMHSQEDRAAIAGARATIRDLGGEA